MTSAPVALPEKPPLMQRILGAIERGGNKMPNPAILFVWLCVIVIVLSALLAWADIKRHVRGRQAAADRRRGGRPGRLHAALRRPAGCVRPGRRIHGRRGDGGDPEPPVRRRRSLPLHVVRRQLPQLRSGRDHPRGDDRRRPRGGRRADRGADPQARRRLVGGDADADHHLHRRPLEHRLGCRVSRADTPGRGRVQERRAQSPRRDGGRVRGGRRGVRRQLPDHAARRRADRDHERCERARRPRPLDRPRGEPLLRHRLDDPGHDRPDARLRVHRRAQPRQARPALESDDESLDADKGPEVSPEAEAKGFATPSSRPWPCSSGSRS